MSFFAVLSLARFAIPKQYRERSKLCLPGVRQYELLRSRLDGVEIANRSATRSTAFPQPAPGTAPSPGPLKVPDDKLRSLLGIASVTFKQNEQRLAIIDTALQK